MKGLGKRLHDLRKSRKMTLVELARKTGIDQATLSRIENGKMTGTLESHMLLATALGVRLPDLYNEVLTIAGEAKEKEVRQKLETFSYSTGAVAELLTTGILQKKMMPILLKIKGGGHTETEEYPAGTERFLYVIKGAVELNLGTDKQPLKSGQSAYFGAAQPHSIANPSSNEAWCLSIMTPASL